MTTFTVTFSNENLFLSTLQKGFAHTYTKLFYLLSKILFFKKSAFCHRTYKNYPDWQVAVGLITLLIVLPNLSALISEANCLSVLPLPIFCFVLQCMLKKLYIFCSVMSQGLSLWWWTALNETTAPHCLLWFTKKKKKINTQPPHSWPGKLEGFADKTAQFKLARLWVFN